ncbi:hypothetical protein ACFVAD_07655 [Sutcliffiella sp. NPDC057660]|uniref:hypothetical protein n=1 Tax=Sutcliffiella sp. NPDC057660 TaxID=3346199 RepID=UPI0036A4BF89
MLGHFVVDHNENPNWNESSPYPKVGYQVFYRMDIDQFYDFKANYESGERILIHPSEVLEFYHNWNDLYQEIKYYALANILSSRKGSNSEVKNCTLSLYKRSD